MLEPGWFKLGGPLLIITRKWLPVSYSPGNNFVFSFSLQNNHLLACHLGSLREKYDIVTETASLAAKLTKIWECGKGSAVR